MSLQFSSAEVCRAAGISRRQIQHWRSRKFIRSEAFNCLDYRNALATVILADLWRIKGLGHSQSAVVLAQRASLKHEPLLLLSFRAFRGRLRPSGYCLMYLREEAIQQAVKARGPVRLIDLNACRARLLMGKRS